MERTVCHSDIQITSLLRVILINHDIMFRHTQSHHRSYSICIQEQRTYHNEQWFPRFTLLRIDISQALQQSLSTNESECCSILSPVSLTHPNHWDPTPSPSLTPPRLPHHPPMKSTPLRCYLKSVKQDPSFQSAISLFRRWQKNHEDSDDYYCHMRFEDGKPYLSTEAESILSHSIPELSV